MYMPTGNVKDVSDRKGFGAEKLPDFPKLTQQQAEHWIAALLAEASALRQHDEQLYPASNDPVAIGAAEQLHAMWRQWADSADALYERLGPLLKEKRHLCGAHDLNYAIGRTRAMLKLSPQQMLGREDQARRGEVLSAEEVRRELRVAPRR